MNVGYKVREAFIRVTVLRFDPSSRSLPNNPPIDCYVCAKIKDAMPTEKGVVLKQKRRTEYPKWNCSFDSHLNNGRVVQLIVMRKPEFTIGDTTIGIQLLRNHCVPTPGSGPATEASPEIPLSLNPGGTLYVMVRYFPGGSSAASSPVLPRPPGREVPEPAASEACTEEQQHLSTSGSEISFDEEDDTYGEARRRYAIRQPKVIEKRNHKFIETLFKLPTVCSYCSEFVWGLNKPGIKCQDCSCTVHKKCLDNILVNCPGNARDSLETQMLTERFHVNVPHRFTEYQYMKPTFCDQCGGMLYGLYKQGLKCTECGVNCHRKCESHMANLCGMSQKILNELLQTVQAAKAESVDKKPNQDIEIANAKTENFSKAKADEKQKPNNGAQAAAAAVQKIEDSSDKKDDDESDEDEYADVYEALADNAKRFCISPTQSPSPRPKSDQFGYAELRAPPIPSREGRLGARTGVISLYSAEEQQEDYENVIKVKSYIKQPVKTYCTDDFKLLKVLGRGAFGKVLLSQLQTSSEYYAIKALKKDVILEYNDVDCTMLERRVLEMGQTNPYITKLFCTYQTPSHLFFVMEYLTGGDLMYHIQHDKNKKFTNDRAQFYTAEIICGLQFLHSNGIIYRDLKPDNVLLDKEGHVKIADFGMCKDKITGEAKTSTFCGTPHYIAPEIINGCHYNSSVDWFSLGVVLFEMLVGKLPFDGEDEEGLFLSIQTLQPRYPKSLKSDAVSCLQLLLEKKPQDRLGMITCRAGPIRDHPYFKNINWTDIEQRRIEPPFKPKLKSPADARYFESEFTKEPARLTITSKHLLATIDQSLFADFDYVCPATNNNNKISGVPARPVKLR